MRTSAAFERSHSIEASIEKGLKFASFLGLNTSFTAFGNSLPMYRCDAEDAHGRKVSGKGKGIGSQAVASALFEAIEHYCLFSNATQTLPSLRLGEHPLDGDVIDGSPTFSLLSVKQAPPLSRIVFKSLGAPEIEVAAPAFLFDPDFGSQSAIESEYLRKSGLCRYSTNSGTAAGTTLEDAQLHALIELVERDALSIELLATIFASHPRPVRRIINESLTDDLKELVTLAERETRGTVTIWYIASDLQIPAILIRLTGPSESSYGYFGSGASLYVEYAIERALTEAVQGFHIYTAELCRPRLANTEKLEHRSPYRRCLLEYGFFEYGGGEQEVSLSTIVKENPVHPTLTVKEQLEVAIGLLQDAEIPVYGRILISHEIHVVQLYSPCLERFFLVSAGVLVAPGKRGRGILAPVNHS